MCSDLPSDGGDKGLPELLEYRLAGMALAHRVVHHVLQTADVLSYTVSVLCGGGSRALQRRQPLSDLPLPFRLGCPLCDDLRTAMAMAPHNHRHLSLGNVLRGRGRGRRRTAEPSQTFHPSAWTASSQPCPTNHHSRYRDTPALRRELSKVSTTVGRQRTGSVSSLDHGGYRARYRPSPCGAALHRASCSGSSSSPSSPPSSSLQQRDQKLLHEPVRRQCPPNPPGHRAAAAWAAAACQWRGGGHHLRMSNTPRRVVRPGEARSQLPVTQASTTEATSLASGSSLRQTADHMSSAMYVQISQPSCSATVPACSRLSCHPSYRVNGERVDAYARAFNVQRPPSPFPCAPHGDAPTSQRCNGQLRHCCGSIQPGSTAP